LLCYSFRTASNARTSYVRDKARTSQRHHAVQLTCRLGSGSSWATEPGAQDATHRNDADVTGPCCSSRCGNFTIMAYALSRVDLDSSRVDSSRAYNARSEERGIYRVLYSQEETRSIQLRPQLAKYKTSWLSVSVASRYSTCKMVSAMLVSCGSVGSVCRPAVASFTSRSPVRARPQLRMRTVSMASPELVSFSSMLSAF